MVRTARLGQGQHFRLHGVGVHEIVVFRVSSNRTYIQSELIPLCARNFILHHRLFRHVCLVTLWTTVICAQKEELPGVKETRKRFGESGVPKRCKMGYEARWYAAVGMY